MRLPNATRSFGLVIGVISLALVTLLLAVFFGMVAGIGSVFLTVVFGILFLGVTLFILAQFYHWSIPQLTLTAIFTFFFLLEVVYKIIGVPLYGYWQLLVLMMGFFGLNILRKEIINSTILILSALAFSVFLFLAIVSTLYTLRSTTDAALFQFVSDLKFPMALAFGLYINTKVNVQNVIDRTILIFIPISIFFIGLQWVAPHIYLSVFGASTIPYERSSIFPSPALSLFKNPAILAATASMLAIYTFVKWKIDKHSPWYAWLLFVALVFMVMASNQRQEIFSFILVILLTYLLISKQGVASRALVSSLFGFVLLLGFIWIFADMFTREATSWGISTVRTASHPRAELYEGAVTIAKTYFPLGSGLGTFGGAGSAKYDLSLAYELGFGNNWWWYKKEAYLLDTYWPNSLAESGVMGAFFLLLHYLLFAFFSFLKMKSASSEEARMYWLTSGSSFLWVLLVTPTSPGFQEVRLLFFPALMFGMAVIADRKARNA